MTVCGVGVHTLEERGDQHYKTSPLATRALIAEESKWIPRHGWLWEPACSDGTGIVLPLREAGFNVVASDIRDRQCPDSWVSDFFNTAGPGDLTGIITNPPFSMARDFIDRALNKCGYVAMLLRLAFLEGNARKPWFQSGPLARVHVSSRRLPMMHREGWTGPKAGSAVCHAWFVWDVRHEGRPTINWFDYKTEPVVAANDNTDPRQIDLEEFIEQAAA
jgi:hypothetical protein